MKNIRLWLILLLLSIFSFSAHMENPVFAEEPIYRVMTDTNIDETDLMRLEEILDSYSKNYNTDIVFYVAEDIADLGFSTIEEWEDAVIADVEGIFSADKVILFTLDGKTKHISYFLNPEAENVIVPEALRVISDHFLLPYYEGGMLAEGIEHSADLIDAVIRKRKIKVFDFAEVLTETQRSNLENRIGEIQDKYNMEIVYLLDDDFGYEGDIKYFAADFYDYLGFGSGDRKDGLLYVQNFAQRKFYTLGTGRGEDLFPSDLLDELRGGFVGYLKADDYYNAYLKQLDDFEAVLNGSYFAAENASKFMMGLGISFLVAVLITAVSAFSQKIVVKKTTAAEYIVPGDLVLTENIDRYTHTTTTREKISKDNDSGGSFSGSSGSSHSGSGGSY